MAWIDGDDCGPRAKGALVDEAQVVRFKSWARADKFKRDIVENIEACDGTDELADYVLAETPVIDGIQAFDAAMYHEVIEAAENQRAVLIAGAQSMQRAQARASESGGSGHVTKGKQAMAANPDFKKVVQKDVELLWPRLDQTYRYNSHKKQSEPAEPGMQGAAWSVNWKLSKDAALELFNDLKAHYEDCRSRNPKLPEFGTVFGMKALTDEDGNKTGEVKFSAKKNGMSNAGNANKPPRVVGRDLQDFPDKAVWSGTVAHVRANAFATTDADGKGGVSLLLDAVQILEAAYGSDNLEDDFGPAEPNLGDEEQKEVERQAEQKPAMADLDDDLPF